MPLNRSGGGNSNEVTLLESCGCQPIRGLRSRGSNSRIGIVWTNGP